ncbi:putative flavoprotein involved in K+ transport [metagenome]|uniref:Putative flavoprotein involved in K+ transport n=1 Tax=metagenome TaxID=256318 RepID=A0A2P2CAB1_9ZZZZ
MAHLTSERDRVTVAIIGSGLGGLACAVRLQQRGITDVVVLERSDGIGGTWWDTRFPGAEVDVTSELYSFSFMPWTFSRTHAGHVELREYVARVAERFGLRRSVRLRTAVREVRWLEEADEYELTLATGGTLRARHVVSAVGMLTEPRTPDLVGSGSFGGRVFHTSRWPADASFSGRRVAVVGTGSTSAQIVPELARESAQLLVFQRQPGWVLPKPDRDYEAPDLARLNRPGVRRWRRWTAFRSLEKVKSAAETGSKQNLAVERVARAYLESAVSDPIVRSALTPDYPFSGKRTVLSQYYLPTFNRDDVTLVPHAVQRLEPGAVVDASGERWSVDDIVLATGFKASEYLSTLTVVGPGGRDLHEHWAGEPRAFLGMMVTGFPNFFIMYGPNTNGGSVLFTLECQAQWIADSIRRAGPERVVLVRPGLESRLDTSIQRRNKQMAWSQADNYFRSASGRVVTQWPFTQTRYWFLSRLLRGRTAMTFRPAAVLDPSRTQAGVHE